MFNPTELGPDERVLFLGIPDAETVEAVSARLSNGVVVALGDAEQVREARRKARDLHNVMFVPGTPEEIPWEDGFFTRVIDLVREWPSPDRVRREILRVSAGQG